MCIYTVEITKLKKLLKGVRDSTERPKIGGLWCKG